jgi:hypothetical protein
VDGYLDVLRSKQDGGEWDDSRLGLAGHEENGANVCRPINKRQ